MHGPWMLRLRWLETASMAAVVLLLGGCGGGGDRDAQLKLQLSLLSSVACYGTHIELPLIRTGVKLTKPLEADCSIATDAAGAGCAATTSFDNQTLTLDLRDCFVSNDELLFDCNLRGYRTDGPATVQCGCGCQNQCPGQPAICVTREGREPCDISSLRSDTELSLSANSTAASVPDDIVATSSTTTPCGTCCDVGVDFDAMLDAAVTLSELSFEIDISTNDPTCPDFDGCFDLPLGTDGPGFVRESNGLVRICVSDAAGFTGPALIAQCSMVSDGVGVGAVTVLRALDVDLQPVVPLPPVSVQAR